MPTTREVGQPEPSRRSVMVWQLERAVTEARRVWLFDVITCRYVEVQRVSFMLALQRTTTERRNANAQTVTRGDDLFVSLGHPAGTDIMKDGAGNATEVD